MIISVVPGESIVRHGDRHNIPMGPPQEKRGRGNPDGSAIYIYIYIYSVQGRNFQEFLALEKKTEARLLGTHKAWNTTGVFLYTYNTSRYSTMD